MEVPHSTTCAKHEFASTRRRTSTDVDFTCDCGAEIATLRAELEKAKAALGKMRRERDNAYDLVRGVHVNIGKALGDYVVALRDAKGETNG